MSLFNASPVTGQGPQKKTISAQFVAKATTSYPRSQRADDAAQWLRGKAEIIPTLKLAAETFGVQPAEVKAACRRLERRNRPDLSDDVVERIVIEIGPERVLKAVDRLTEPPLPFLVAAE
jgi:hypothetical protein